ncbi:Hypothetical predicted protein, partial [Olea europaea subsp. europaea]
VRAPSFDSVRWDIVNIDKNNNPIEPDSLIVHFDGSARERTGEAVYREVRGIGGVYGGPSYLRRHAAKRRAEWCRFEIAVFDAVSTRPPPPQQGGVVLKLHSELAARDNPSFNFNGIENFSFKLRNFNFNRIEDFGFRSDVDNKWRELK